MKRGGIGRALNNHSLLMLMAEAVWRGIRLIRKRLFHRRGTGSAHAVRFAPIGYYHSQEGRVAETDREAILTYAEAILRGEYPLLGYGSPALGTSPDWHCDWVSGKRWPLEDSAQLQIVRHDGSDVKAPWELSRLQFAPVVAKAFVLTGDRKYREGLRSLLSDWIARNPLGKGIHWTIAMEAALRAISMCLTIDLLWPFTAEEELWLAEMTASLWQHLRFIETHSEFSFLMRSNHYLSNIVGLTTLSAYLVGPGMKGRLRRYKRAVNREIGVQTYADGGDYEASTGYHVLVAQMFLHSYVVQQRTGGVIPNAFHNRLQRMFEWISILADGAGRLPLLGDCDNGRVELEVDDLALDPPPGLFVGALCERASQLLQLSQIEKEAPKPVTLLGDSGLAVLRAGNASAIFCAMPNGIHGKGSHTHCDKLSVLLRFGLDTLFGDSGSRYYTRSAELRNRDRSTRAHSTLMVDDVEQNKLSADPGLLFQSGNEAVVSPIALWHDGETTARASHRGYAGIGVEHQRTVRLSPYSLLVLDEVTGTGEHLLDLRYVLEPAWQVTPETSDGRTVSCVIAGRQRLTLRSTAESFMTLSIEPVEISRAYGSWVATSSIRIQTVAALPARVQTRVEWN
jgi:hypothetical protein